MGLSYSNFFKLCLISIVLLAFSSCGDKDDDVLAYGLSKTKADKMLTNASPRHSSSVAACPKLLRQTSENIKVTRQEKIYLIEESKKPSMKRVVIFHKAKPGTELGWKWEANLQASVFGKFYLESSPSCFYLGEKVGIKAEVLGKLKLLADNRHRIRNVLVFDSYVEKVKNCPYQKSLKNLSSLYKQSSEDFTDEQVFRKFLKAFLSSLKYNNCKRGFDSSSVSMYKLCGHLDDAPCEARDPEKWIRYIDSQKNRFPIAKKILASKLFQSSLDASLLEEFGTK